MTDKSESDGSGLELEYHVLTRGDDVAAFNNLREAARLESWSEDDAPVTE